MKNLLAKYAARAVPRYTSYPTVPHFDPAFSPELYRTWLQSLDPRASVSLYLHVPFCRKMCWYCGCNMKLAARYEPVADYVEALLAEIDLVAVCLPPTVKVSHLHWGGGTPTVLDERDLARVMERLHERFTIDDDAELAIESDPRTLSDTMAKRIGELGFTRASFGVQEFDPEVQRAINRVQPPELVARCVARLREAGVEGINFDLIYGLPFQTVTTLEQTIAATVEIAPDRLALFGYAHVPWMAKNQKMIPADALPDMRQRSAQAAAAATALVEADYRPIGLDHFARPDDPLTFAAQSGALRRNFQGYTTDTAEALIGFGATAIGRTPFGYTQNIAETGAWARAVRAGSLPIAKGHAMSAEDRLRAGVIERIMCDGAVDTSVAAWSMRVTEDWCAEEFRDLHGMAADGVLELDGGHIKLTEAGRPLARVVAAVFDTYLRQSSARHSVAV